jgi:hypothetical protein
MSEYGCQTSDCGDDGKERTTRASESQVKVQDQREGRVRNPSGWLLLILLRAQLSTQTRIQASKQYTYKESTDKVQQLRYLLRPKRPRSHALPPNSGQRSMNRKALQDDSVVAEPKFTLARFIVTWSVVALDSRLAALIGLLL